MRHYDGRRDRKEPVDHAVLRKKIEDAINDSLDPLAAHKALKSLHPLLQDLSECKKEDWSFQTAPSNSDVHQKQLFKKSLKSGHDELEQKPIYLPSIQKILTDYKVKLSLTPIKQHPAKGDTSGKLSAACDKVKAVHERSKHELYQRCKDSETSRSSHGESSYDSSAAVMLLRLERLTRREKFSLFWQWKSSDHGTSESGMTGQSSKDYGHTGKNIDRGVKAVDKATRESKVDKVRRMQEIYRSQALESDHKCVRSSDSIPSLLAPPTLPAHIGIKALDNSAADEMHTVNEKSIAVQRIGTSGKRIDGKKNVTDSDLSMISRYFMTARLSPCSPSERSIESSAITNSRGTADNAAECLQCATVRRAETESGVRTKTVAGAGAGVAMRTGKKTTKGVGVAIVDESDRYDADHIKSISDGIQESNSKPSTARSSMSEYSAGRDIIGNHRLNSHDSEHQNISPHPEPSLLLKQKKEIESARGKAFSKKGADRPSELLGEGYRYGHEYRHENDHGHESRQVNENRHEFGHTDGRRDCSIGNSEEIEEIEECDWDCEWEDSTQHTSSIEDPQRARGRNGDRGQVQDLLDWMTNLDPDTV